MLVERTIYREVPVPVYGEEKVVVKEVTVPVEVIREVAVPVEHVVTKEVHVPVEVNMQSETRVGESRIVIGEETRASAGVFYHPARILYLLRGSHLSGQSAAMSFACEIGTASAFCVLRSLW